MLAPVEVQKVHNESQTDPVDQIAENSTHNARHRQTLKEAFFHQGPAADHQQNQRDDGDPHQEVAGTRHHTPGRACVMDVGEVEYRRQGPLVTHEQVPTYQLLGDLIQNQYESRQIDHKRLRLGQVSTRAELRLGLFELRLTAHASPDKRQRVKAGEPDGTRTFLTSTEGTVIQTT